MRQTSHDRYKFSHFRVKEKVFLLKLLGKDSEQAVFGLTHNFTRKNLSSSLKRIFHISQQECGVDCKISGV